MGIDNKTKKNASDILALENKLKQKEDIINENEGGLSFNRGFFFYKDQSYLTYECNRIIWFWSYFQRYIRMEINWYLQLFK